MPACASKQDVLEIATLRYVKFRGCQNRNFVCTNRTQNRNLKWQVLEHVVTDLKKRTFGKLPRLSCKNNEAVFAQRPG